MKTTTLAICASLFISSIAVSQASTPPAEQPQGRPTGGGSGGPGGPEGQGGPGGQGATQLVQRLMQSDKNGDGKLSAEELPPQFAEIFPVIDTNKDGLLDQTEILVLAKSQGEARGGPRGGRGGAGGAPQNFDGAMKQVNRGFKGLKGSEFDATTKAKDLEQVQIIQSGLVAAKGMASSVRMAPQAKAKYGDDNGKYVMDMRTQLLAALTISVALESAVLAGDSAAAKAAVAKLELSEDKGHEEFQPDEDEQPAAKPAAPAGAK
jgi:EF hand